MEMYLLLSAILLSLGLFGLIRSAIWLLPGLVWRDYWSLAPAIVLSFITSAALMAPYRGACFDFRDWDKTKWILLFFLSGLLSGSLLYPSSILIFGLGSLGPIIFVRLCLIFRQPLSRVYVFPNFLRYLVIGSFAGALLLKFLWPVSQAGGHFTDAPIF